MPTPSPTVTSRRVISSRIGWLGSLAKRTSRLVMMPTRRPVRRAITGMPEIDSRLMMFSASDSGWSGWMVIGLTTMPDS